MRRSGPMSSRANAALPPSTRKASRRSSTSMPATSGISRAGSATRSRASAPRTACSCWCKFGTFSITDWVGHTPPEVLAKYFGVPASTFANFPKREVYIAKGPVPPPLPANPAPGALDRGPLTHRYQLLAQRPDTYSGGTNRLVSQRQFPISTTVTGALMQIKPGGLREPHWHPNADEWQYYISGRARMTVFGSHGRVRTEEFNAGDVGYVPQGYGHYIENIGNEDVELLIALNNGVYESISLADWIGANPHLLLATNFEVPESTFKDFQTRNRFLVG